VLADRFLYHRPYPLAFRLVRPVTVDPSAVAHHRPYSTSRPRISSRSRPPRQPHQGKMRVTPLLTLPVLLLSFSGSVLAEASGSRSGAKTSHEFVQDANRLLAEGSYNEAARAYSEAIGRCGRSLALLPLYSILPCSCFWPTCRHWTYRGMPLRTCDHQLGLGTSEVLPAIQEGRRPGGGTERVTQMCSWHQSDKMDRARTDIIYQLLQARYRVSLHGQARLGTRRFRFYPWPEPRFRPGRSLAFLACPSDEWPWHGATCRSDVAVCRLELEAVDVMGRKGRREADGSGALAKSKDIGQGGRV
jgi:hypothetical protein